MIGAGEIISLLISNSVHDMEVTGALGKVSLAGLPQRT